MSALALKLGLEQFIGKRRTRSPLRTVLQQFMKIPAGPSGKARAPLVGRRILLAPGAEPLAETLRRGGAEVLQATAAAGVLEQLCRHDRIDAILLSLEANGQEALDTARAIRTSGARWNATPLVGLAAITDASVEAAAAAAGINGLLVKPVEKTLLYETLTRLIAVGASRAQRAQSAAASTGDTAVASAVPDPLLNVARLESYKRLAMLEELVNDYLPEMRRLLNALQEAVRQSDTQASLAALHSLLGMSGEAGAQGLYQHVRKLYVPLLEHGEWPAPADWLAQLRQLAARTEEALKAYCAQQARSSAA